MNNLSIPDWTKRLEDVIPSDCVNQRPFACDGFSNPSDCDIIIIGKNPATQLGVNWRKCFWNEQSGFQHQAFVDVYSKKGRSNTRKFFDYIKAKGFNCIEINVYRNEGSKQYIPRKHRICNLAVVQALICNIPKLKGIIAHGVPAKECLPSLQVPAHVKIYPMDHFSDRKKGHTDDYVKAKLDVFCEKLKRGI